MDASTPSREVLWNINHEWIMYPCLVLALVACAYFLVRRMKLWTVGQPIDRTSNVGERLKGAFVDAVLQSTVLRKKGVGAMHLGMYVGMLILVIATACYAAYVDLGINIVTGDFYLYFLALTVDVAGLVFCMAMLGCIIRRIVLRNTLISKPSDYILLAMLFIIGASGFVVEGLRIVGTNDPWAAWSPVGYAISLLFQDWSAEQISIAHRVFWWGHMAIAFAMIATWTYSKLVHVLLVPAAVYCRDLNPKGTLPYIDIEDENLETMGVGKLEEFTWKDLLDTQACVRCNRCVENCPANISGKLLSPKGLMQNLYAEMQLRAPIVMEERAINATDGKQFDPTNNQKSILGRTLVGDVVTPEELWACTTCGSCSEHCPSHLEHPSKIAKMRTYQVSMESSFPPEAQTTFRNLENNGNPWGVGWQTRKKWAEELDVPVLADNPEAEYLYWPGCSGAMDARNRKVSTALVQLLKKANVSFAILGNEEKCCGDSARRMGNEYVYYLLASENISTLSAYGVKKIITQCPHCYQALSRDYPQLGGNYEVIHHAELLFRLVNEGRLHSAIGSKTVAFHDSCYLGRYHGIYQEPRDVVVASGCQVVEMDRHHEKSFCCGAGGGRMWLEENEGERINVVRSKQALGTGAHSIATSCPFCLTMLSDGIAGLDGEKNVKDIAELLLEAQPKERV